jgi:hypothetical protein
MAATRHRADRGPGCQVSFRRRKIADRRACDYEGMDNIIRSKDVDYSVWTWPQAPGQPAFFQLQSVRFVDGGSISLSYSEGELRHWLRRLWDMSSTEIDGVIAAAELATRTELAVT